MSYSLWLLPQEPKVKTYLNSVVTRLIHQEGGPTFEPHLTLLTDVDYPLDQMKTKSIDLAKHLKPFTVETGTVEYSTTNYQNLFVRIKPNPELMSAYVTAKRIFNLTAPSTYMPHVSLLYGDQSFTQKHHLMTSLHFIPQRFSVASLIVVPGGESPPSEWRHLAEFPFTV